MEIMPSYTNLTARIPQMVLILHFDGFGMTLALTVYKIKAKE